MGGTAAVETEVERAVVDMEGAMELPNAITFASGADPPTGRVFEK